MLLLQIFLYRHFKFRKKVGLHVSENSCVKTLVKVPLFKKEIFNEYMNVGMNVGKNVLLISD